MPENSLHMNGTYLEKLGLMPFVGCVLLARDIIQIPARIEAMVASWDWIGVSFDDPKCGELGFDDIKKQYESGITSQSEGISRTTLPTSGSAIAGINYDPGYITIDEGSDGIIDGVIEG